MNEVFQAPKNNPVAPKSGGRGSLHKNEPRDKVVRIRSNLFKEMTEGGVVEGFGVDFDDIISEVWESYKKVHKKRHAS